jgi:hypothetical protein
MEQVESIFKSAADSYRHAEESLIEAETSLRKLLAKFLVAEIEKPAPAPVPVTPRRELNPEIWSRVDALLAERRAAAKKKAEPATP